MPGPGLGRVNEPLSSLREPKVQKGKQDTGAPSAHCPSFPLPLPGPAAFIPCWLPPAPPTRAPWVFSCSFPQPFPQKPRVSLENAYHITALIEALQWLPLALRINSDSSLWPVKPNATHALPVCPLISFFTHCSTATFCSFLPLTQCRHLPPSVHSL